MAMLLGPKRSPMRCTTCRSCYARAIDGDGPSRCSSSCSCRALGTTTRTALRGFLRRSSDFDRADGEQHPVTAVIASIASPRSPRCGFVLFRRQTAACLPVGQELLRIAALRSCARCATIPTRVWSSGDVGTLVVADAISHGAACGIVARIDYAEAERAVLYGGRCVRLTGRR